MSCAGNSFKLELTAGFATCYKQLVCLVEFPECWKQQAQSTELKIQEGVNSWTINFILPSRIENKKHRQLPLTVSLFGLVNIRHEEGAKLRQLGYTCLDAGLLWHWAQSPGEVGRKNSSFTLSELRVEEAARAQWPSLGSKEAEFLKKFRAELLDRCMETDGYNVDPEVPFATNGDRRNNLGWIDTPWAHYMPGDMYVYLLYQRVRRASPLPHGGGPQLPASYPAEDPPPATYRTAWLNALKDAKLAHWTYHCAWALHRLGLPEAKIWSSTKKSTSPYKCLQKLSPTRRGIKLELPCKLDKPWTELLALAGEILAEMVGFPSHCQWYLDDELDVCPSPAVDDASHKHRLRDQVRHTFDLPSGRDVAKRCDDCESLALSCYIQFVRFRCWAESLTADQVLLLPPIMALVRLCALFYYSAAITIGKVNFSPLLRGSSCVLGKPASASREESVALARRTEEAYKCRNLRLKDLNVISYPSGSGDQSHVYLLLVPRQWFRQVSRGCNHPVGLKLPFLLIDGTSLSLANPHLFDIHGPQPALCTHLIKEGPPAVAPSKLVHIRENPRVTCRRQPADGYRSITYLYAPADGPEDCFGQFAVRASGYFGSDGTRRVGAPVCCVLSTQSSCKLNHPGVRVDLEPVGYKSNTGSIDTDDKLQYLLDAMPPPLLPPELSPEKCKEYYNCLIPQGFMDDQKSFYGIYYSVRRSCDFNGKKESSLLEREGAKHVELSPDFFVWYQKH